MQNVEEKSLKREASNQGYSWYCWFVIQVLFFAFQNENQLNIKNQSNFIFTLPKAKILIVVKKNMRMVTKIEMWRQKWKSNIWLNIYLNIKYKTKQKTITKRQIWNIDTNIYWSCKAKSGNESWNWKWRKWKEHGTGTARLEMKIISKKKNNFLP